MKKTLSFVLLFVLSITSTFANVTTTESNGYNTPILDSTLNFSARIDGNKVYTSWAKYNQADSLVYYKVIRSKDNANPVYPDNGYIYYTTDINVTSYTDETPLSGSSYYRVCAITSEKNRYCSNVVSINKPTEVKVGGDKDAHGCYISAGYSWCEIKNKCLRTWEEKCEIDEAKVCSMEAKICSDGSYVSRTGPNCEFKSCPKPSQDNTLKQRAEKLVNAFIVKVEKAYSTNEKRISILTIVIEKLNKLAETKPSQKQLIDFIITKFNSKIESYKGNDLNDIESIFNNIQ